MKERQSNIELLRIMSMFAIVAHHFSIHGSFSFDNGTITLNRIWLQFLLMGGKIGVNIFVLISGYFLINSTKLSIEKIIRMWLQLFSYAVALYFLFHVFYNAPLNIHSLIQNCLPVTYSQWWFASSYFILYLLSPYLGIMLKSLSQDNYRSLLIIMFIMWSIVPTVIGEQLQGNNLLFFIFLFALGGYIRIYWNDSKWGYKFFLYISIIAIMICFLLTIIFDLLGTRINWFGNHATYLFGMQMIPTVFISVTIFLTFAKVEIKNSKIINIISSSTFGIYLLHDYTLCRDKIWTDIFKNAAYAESKLLIPYSLLAVLLVFVICMVIELLRLYLFERNYMKLVNNIISKITRSN